MSQGLMSGLIEVGLTSNQAKVYLTLVQLESAPASAISKVSKIARAEVYRILTSLGELGLIDQIVSSPIIYSALHPKQAISNLLERRAEEHTLLQKKTINLLNQMEGTSLTSVPSLLDYTFVITKEKKRITQKYDQDIINSKCTIDIFGPWYFFAKGLASTNFPMFLQEVMKKGIKCRALIEKPPEDYRYSRTDKGLWSNPFFTSRYVLHEIPIVATIYDRKSVNINLAVYPDVAEPNLWSNNPAFVKAIQGYFDELWERATPFEPNK
jgi:HTH-type transcriptional regulator, sugar sensing transcriptional regulator